MPRPARSKKKSLTGSVPRPSVDRSLARSQINAYHRALKERSTAETREGIPVGDSAPVTLDEYQRLSQLGQDGQRGGDSSKVLISWLSALVDKASLEGRDRIRLLEIGAVRPDNYAAHQSWIACTPIDLNSQHPAIRQQDFLLSKPSRDSAARYDVISCSLVLNFVSDPVQRGRMLQLVHDHLKPDPKSLLFLVLPLPCVANSRYLTMDTLREIMGVIGFQLIRERSRSGGKVGYWLWSWRPSKVKDAGNWDTRKIVREGGKRNNFSILLNAAFI